MRPTGWLRHQVIVALVLAASLSTTGWLWQHEREIVERDRAARLDFDLRELAGRIEQRMAAHAQVLQGVQGLFAAARGMPGSDRELLRVYVDALRLGADFAGLGGIGFASQLPLARRDAVLATLRRQGVAGFRILPGGERSAYAPVLQMEPAVAANQPWLGVDLLAAAEYRAAMQVAQPSGRVAITARLPARGDGDAAGNGGGDGDGIAMLAPVRAGAAQRRGDAIDGWVIAPLRVDDMMASLYGEAIPGVDVRLFDGVAANAQTLLYDSTAVGNAQRPKAMAAGWAEAVEYIAVAGRTWTLAVRTRAGRDAARGTADRATIIAVAGAGLSAALTALTWVLLTGRARALAIARRMTRELQESESRFRYLAQYDELTRLPNRALFSDRLHQALAQARRERARLALMYIDLDRFKPVNDALGHGVGDLLLAEVARRMLHSVRESDTVARIGGDEFVVLLPAIRENRDALGVAEKIRHALNQPFVLDGGHTVSISSSTGVAFFPEHGDDGDRLSASADAAMYDAKHGGRDRVAVCNAPAAALT